MPPIEIGPTRPVTPVQVSTVCNPAGHLMPAKSKADFAKPQVAVHSAHFDPGTPPVDTERVAVIRKAVEQGSYPVLPAKIADAMIAAGMLLRSKPA